MPQAVRLVVEDGSLTTLQKKLDDVRALLSESPAGAPQLAEATTARADFGGHPLPSADRLSQQCARVEQEVAEFAELLGDAIEAMGIQARIAEHGYESVEQESIARLHEIGQRLDASVPGTPGVGRGAGDRPVPPHDADHAAAHGAPAGGVAGPH